jgi:hypothetical protein
MGFLLKKGRFRFMDHTAGNSPRGAGAGKAVQDMFDKTRAITLSYECHPSLT